jgi:hypothetical protein
MKIYKAVQKLLVEDTQTADLINLLSFLESSRLKKKAVLTVKKHCFIVLQQNTTIHEHLVYDD